MARTSAESLAQAIHNDLTRVDRLRFASAKRMSLELARTISDASNRDAALRHIIQLCMTANDLEASKILVQGIQSEPIREELLRGVSDLAPLIPKLSSPALILIKGPACDRALLARGSWSIECPWRDIFP